jgi:hypothetical protein
MGSAASGTEKGVWHIEIVSAAALVSVSGSPSLIESHDGKAEFQTGKSM